LRRIFWLAGFSFLAGCAAQQESSRPDAVSADARYRARVHTDLAANYFARRQYAIALDETRISLESDPGYVAAHNVMGLTYMELKEDAKAQAAFQRALQLAPQDPDVNNNYGWFVCNRGRVSEAFRYFDAALKDPLYTTPHKTLVNAGVCARKAGDARAAEDYFLKALKLQLSDPLANFHMADLNYGRRDYPNARAYLNRAMESQNPSAEALWLGVRVERKLSDRVAEASYAAKLKRRYPESNETRLLQSGKYE
jgi:type IV pilus assembly protein PilF